MIHTYLSVDMDFFNCFSQKDSEKVLHKLLTTIKNKNIPILSVMNHQQLLPHANSIMCGVNGTKSLINVDQHSDVCSEHDLKYLNCGTWVSYVNWRGNSDYFWIRSNSQTSVGNCNLDYRWDKGSNWKKLTTNYKSPNSIENLIDNSVIGVGLCMSPSYSIKRNKELFYTLVKEYNLPYKKGRLYEYSLECYRVPTKVVKNEN